MKTEIFDPEQVVKSAHTGSYEYILHRLATLCQPGNFACFFVVCCFFFFFFFQNQLFRKILSGIPSECQKVWIQIRPDILLGLIWVQTLCKGYQQTTLELRMHTHVALNTSSTNV